MTNQKESKVDTQTLENAYDLIKFIGIDLEGAKEIYSFSKSHRVIKKSGREITVEELKNAISIVEKYESSAQS
ncbi:TPA: hypothetical protein ACGIK9_003337 [Acinetobacter baumannii]|uniref:hypothetical protein n=1 Tax=Acinetobacter baumannii TaxID=470 RepID=UPI00339042E3